MDIFLSSASCYKKEMYLMKTKRLIAVILAVVMCLSAMALLSSCGNSKKDDAGITVLTPKRSIPLLTVLLTAAICSSRSMRHFS